MSLDGFFQPKSVAIVGASHTAGKIGYEVLANFVGGTYKGKIYPINPDTEPILGKDVYSSLTKIKDRIDLVIVIVPAKLVPTILKQCVDKNVKSVIIISSGFSEIGGEGKKLEEECSKIVRGTGTRVIGPNCIGIYDSESQVDTLFLSRRRMGRPGKGGIAFISQSGAVGSTILDWLSEQNIGASKFISYGNGMDVDESDLIEYLGNDKSTKVVTAYIEGLKGTGERFLKVCKSVSKKKPVVILKSGKTEHGTKAVSSHTGSLAGAAEIYSGAFKQCNTIEAGSWQELFDFARAFATQPLSKGKDIAIITDGGGFGVLATDEAERQNLNLPEPSEKIKKKISKVMPAYGILHNPIDLTGDADAERYRVAIEACLESGEYDGVISITLFQVPTLEEKVVDYIIQLNKKYDKPLLVCSAGGKFTEKLNYKLVSAGIPVYPSPERAVRAMKALVDYSVA